MMAYPPNIGTFYRYITTGLDRLCSESVSHNRKTESKAPETMDTIHLTSESESESVEHR